MCVMLRRNRALAMSWTLLSWPWCTLSGLTSLIMIEDPGVYGERMGPEAGSDPKVSLVHGPAQKGLP